MKENINISDFGFGLRLNIAQTKRAIPYRDNVNGTSKAKLNKDKTKQPHTPEI